MSDNYLKERIRELSEDRDELQRQVRRVKSRKDITPLGNIMRKYKDNADSMWGARSDEAYIEELEKEISALREYLSQF
jgi:uncharacterized coiled-coil DUF342 family protein